MTRHVIDDPPRSTPIGSSSPASRPAARWRRSWRASTPTCSPPPACTPAFRPAPHTTSPRRSRSMKSGARRARARRSRARAAGAPMIVFHGDADTHRRTRSTARLLIDAVLGDEPTAEARSGLSPAGAPARLRALRLAPRRRRDAPSLAEHWVVHGVAARLVGGAAAGSRSPIPTAPMRRARCFASSTSTRAAAESTERRARASPAGRGQRARPSGACDTVDFAPHESRCRPDRRRGHRTDRLRRHAGRARPCPRGRSGMAGAVAARRPAGRPRPMVGAVRRPDAGATGRRGRRRQPDDRQRRRAHRRSARHPRRRRGGAAAERRRDRQRRPRPARSGPAAGEHEQRRPAGELGARRLRRQPRRPRRRRSASRRRRGDLARRPRDRRGGDRQPVHRPARLRGAAGADAARRQLARRDRTPHRTQHAERLRVARPVPR